MTAISLLPLWSPRSLLAGALGFLILAGTALTPLVAQAQTEPPADPGTPAQTSEPTQTAQTSGKEGSGFDLGQATIGAVLSPVALLAFAILQLSKAILWVAGIVMNFSVSVLVFGFSQYLGTTAGMLFAWSILRDLGNILLLFGFIYIGIQTILNIGHFSVGKALPRLVIFAVLLNFSLFASAFIVDISNALSAALFSQSAGYRCTEDLESCINDGVVGQIMQQANILTIVGGSTNTDFGSVLSSYFSDPIASTIQYILLAIIVSAAATVLFAGGLLLISRGVALAFVLVTSPIGFAGMVLSPLNAIAKKWWDTLINNALFAPVFLMLLYVGLKLTDGLGSALGVQGGFAAAVSSGNSFDAGPIFLFALVIAFMIAALTVARQFGIAGADFAINKATQLGGIPFLPARDGLSRLSGGATSAYEKRAARAIRSIPVFGRGLDDGIANTLKAGKNVSIPGWGSLPDQDKADKARLDHLGHAEHANHLAHDLEAGIANASKATPDLDLLDKVVNNDMSVKDLKDTDQLKKGAKGIDQIARVLKPSRFRQIIEDKDVDGKVKEKMTAARFGELKKDVAVADRDPAAAARVRKANTDDLEMSGVLGDPAQRATLMRTVSDKQYDELMKKDLGPTTMQKMKEIRVGTGPGSRFQDPATAQATLNGMRPKQRAKLPGATLVSQQVLPQLVREDFVEIALLDEVGGPEKTALVNDALARPGFQAYIQTLGGSEGRRVREYYR